MDSVHQDGCESAHKDLASRVEFFRNCFTLMPSDRQTHQTFLVKTGVKKTKIRLFCSCSNGSYADCSHGRLLQSGFEDISQKHPDPWDRLKQLSLWQILAPLAAKCPYPVSSIRIARSEKAVSVYHKSEIALIRYEGKKADRERFICRFGGDFGDSEQTRHDLLERAAGFVLTDIEKEMISRGTKTSRHASEQSVWFRLAYHCFKECEAKGLMIVPRVDCKRKQFEIGVTSESMRMCWVVVPKKFVAEMIAHLCRLSVSGSGDLLYDETVSLRFDFRKGSEKTSIVPIVEIDCDESKQTCVIDPDLLFGNMAYLKECGLFVRFDAESAKLLATRWGETKEVENEQLAQFLQMHGDIFSRPSESGSSAGQQDLFSLTTVEPTFDRFTNLPLINRFDSVDLKPSAIDQDWCYLSVNYRSGEASISLAQIIQAREQNSRYIISEHGLVDTKSMQTTVVVDQASALSEGDQIKISRASVLQLKQSQTITVNVGGEKDLAAQLRGLVDFSPVKPLKPLTGYTSTLRSYQELGIRWLLFLFDNQLGGLLCDDMGLGKTHQIIAFFVALREQRSCLGQFLVVCPTTVISHWKRLIEQFAPGLKASVHHGVQRSTGASRDADVIITSYGLLRNDLDELCLIPFAVAIFDEAQYLKNAETIASRSAAQIRSTVKIGLSGTPVENSLWDLKALMDLVVPGYLGTGGFFEEKFQQPIELYQNESVKLQLRKLIAPFTLRRSKVHVLDELPEKIEDIRTCELFEQQIHLYREAIETRSEKVLEPLRNSSAAIPYMHIFALLNLLKQICAHPAIVEKNPENYEYYDSGKWELFKELLEESLESGQKVVVFTQYIQMMKIVEVYLQSKNIDSVSLHGSTLNRGAIVERFNNDPGCRVFIGSLKAGGVGIDLTAASVVIHYDRWWNAAKEDQATDRVYRIGQKRGVQVFKLVTEGTLEEKISDIIQKKRNLSDILQENSAEHLKTFTREELLSLLSYTKR